MQVYSHLYCFLQVHIIIGWAEGQYMISVLGFIRFLYAHIIQHLPTLGRE